MRMERVLVTAADIIHVAAEHTNTHNKTLLVTRNKHSKKKQGRNCTYIRHNEALSLNHCCRGKAIIVTYLECVSVALVIQLLQSPCTVLYCHVWPV